MPRPMPIHPISSPRLSAPRPAFPAVSQYRGINLDRQSRFDSRAARRDGDWGILGVSTAFLWLEEESLLACPDPQLCDAAPIVDLWP